MPVFFILPSAILSFLHSTCSHSPIPPDIGSSVTLKRVDINCSPSPFVRNGILNHIAYDNTSFELECVPPEAVPPVSITWYNGGQNLQLLNDTAIEFPPDRPELLRVAMAASRHVGQYHCEVSNVVNQATPLSSNTIEMVVRCELTFVRVHVLLLSFGTAHFFMYMYIEFLRIFIHMIYVHVHCIYTYVMYTCI